MALSRGVQKRLETQGFACSNDADFVKIAPWLRFSPGICTVLMGVGTGLGLTPLLWALVPIAALGAVFPVHPFDPVYNHGLRHLTGTGPLPLNGPPRRFACGVASAWLVATALVFQLGIPAAGYALGAVLTGVAAIVSVSHFCIPSTVYQLLFGRPVARAGV